MSFDLANYAHCAVGFTVSGAYVDPMYIELKVRSPAGNVYTYDYTPTGSSLTKDATGKYSKDVFLNESGQWWWFWVGSGTVFAAEEDFFMVQDSVF